MGVSVFSVEKHSLAHKKGIEPGDELISVNGHPVADVLDYRFYLNDSSVEIAYRNKKGKLKVVKIRKEPEDDIGLGFETYLMDKQHSCKNKCIFCFIDQLPKGLRKSLYFKDDDSRLSFFFGNYITLTNLPESEIDRIINMHISPVNISVHTMNPSLRVEMMKNPAAATSLAYLRKLADAGISMNTQIVLCPGINDGKELEFSLSELRKLYPAVQSVAAVPVGLTCHRDGLYPLHCFKPDEAKKVIDTINAFNEDCVKQGMEPIAYAADEFFLEAGIPIPSEEYYGDYPQLENGVGMWALLRSEFISALDDITEVSEGEVTCITGKAAYPLISGLAKLVNEKFPQRRVNVIGAENLLFGSTVTVAGLLCGSDIAAAAEGKKLGSKVLIPADSLRHERDMFLDDMLLEELEKKIGVKVVPVENDGYSLLSEMTED